MSRDVVVYLEDMVEAVRRVLEYTSGMTREALFADKKTLDAVVAGLRDVLAHEYFAIDDDILWDVVSQKLPPLGPELERILEDERKRVMIEYR